MLLLGRARSSNRRPGVARKYLADIPGSGGTPGFAYLKAHYANKVFSQEADPEPLADLVAMGTHGCVRPLLGPTNCLKGGSP